MRVRVKFEPRDVWVGWFWQRQPNGDLKVYFCPVPMLPFIFTFPKRSAATGPMPPLDKPIIEVPIGVRIEAEVCVGGEIQRHTCTFVVNTLRCLRGVVLPSARVYVVPVSDDYIGEARRVADLIVAKGWKRTTVELPAAEEEIEL